MQYTCKETGTNTDPLLSMSNILNATEKFDSGMLSSVTKKIYLFERNIKPFTHTQSDREKEEKNIKMHILNNTHSLKDISPSLFTSKSIKKSEGGQSKWPGLLSPIKYPFLTSLDSDGGKTGTTARIRSAGFMSNSPSGVR